MKTDRRSRLLRRRSRPTAYLAEDTGCLVKEILSRDQFSLVSADLETICGRAGVIGTGECMRTTSDQGSGADEYICVTVCWHPRYAWLMAGLCLVYSDEGVDRKRGNVTDQSLEEGYGSSQLKETEAGASISHSRRVTSTQRRHG